ncbi:MAG: hypothetical protein IPG45_30240 [Deltaproteobacteria bacterium]|nr:hypothetical protein [Deltaproteobacteria bacterium]
MNGGLLEQAAAIEYADFLRYLDARGWTVVTSRRLDVAVRRKNDAEVVIPVDRDLGDFADAAVAAAQRVAQVEGRSTAAVLADLASVSSDVLRVARFTFNQQGSLPLAEGSDLLTGARTALLASACSVSRPNDRFHRRLTSKSAEAFIDRCRLGHTEHGSFVLTLLCPTELPTEDEPHFGRRTTEGLMRAVATTVALARQGAVDQIIQDPAAAPGLTANLCEAISGMLSNEAEARLSLAMSWSAILPPPTDLPSQVTIDHDLRTTFEDLSERLRPAAEPREGLYYGRVVSLSGEDNAEGQLAGDVTFQLHLGDELLNARASLDARQYGEALEAHRRQLHVAVQGQLVRRARVGTLTNITNLAIWQH